MAAQEQEDDLPSAWTVLSCDGGEFSPAYSVHNMLIPDDDCVYSTAPGRSEDITIVLRYDGPGPFTLKAVSCVAPAAGFTSPLGQALIFTAWDLPQPQRLPRSWSHVHSHEQFKLLAKLHHAQQLQVNQRFVAGLSACRHDRANINHSPQQHSGCHMKLNLSSSEAVIMSLGRITLLLAAATAGPAFTNSQASTRALALETAASITIRTLAMCWGWQATWLVYTGQAPVPIPPPCLAISNRTSDGDGHLILLSEEPSSPSSIQDPFSNSSTEATPLWGVSRENSFPDPCTMDAESPASLHTYVDGPVVVEGPASVVVEGPALPRVASKALVGGGSAAASHWLCDADDQSTCETDHYSMCDTDGHADSQLQADSQQSLDHPGMAPDAVLQGGRQQITSTANRINSRSQQQQTTTTADQHSLGSDAPETPVWGATVLSMPTQWLGRPYQQPTYEQQRVVGEPVRNGHTVDNSTGHGRSATSLPALPSRPSTRKHSHSKGSSRSGSSSTHGSSNGDVCVDVQLPPDRPCPAAFVDLKDRPCCTVPVEPALSGRYVLVKLLRSKYTYADNLDVSYLGLHVHCGPQSFGSIALA